MTVAKGRSSAAGKTVGLAGLGIMGSAFAKHLLAAGWKVAGYDIDRGRRAHLRSSGGRPLPSLRKLVESHRVLITSLPSALAVEAVFFGRDGIAAWAQRGSTVIETSTLPLELKAELHERCGTKGITVLDCPISGTGAQAAAGEIAVYASGSEKHVEAVRPLLEGFARHVHYCGSYGNGSRLKYIANLLVTIHNVSAAEAIVLGRKSGLDLELLYRVIGDGAGSSRMFEVRAPLMIRREYDRPTMKVNVYQKDIDIIGAYATGLHCPTPLFDASKAFYTAAYAQGLGTADTAAVCAVLEQMAASAPERRPDTKRRPRGSRTAKKEVR